MKDKRRRDSSPKRSAKETPVEEPERFPDAMVLRSRRLARDGEKAMVISKPGKLQSNLLIFDKLDYDLVGLGFNYPATLVDREQFSLTAKGCQEAIRTLDFSRVELAHQPSWSFAVDREDSAGDSEYASDEEREEEEDSDYDPEDDSPEYFYTTLDSHEAKLKVEGWTFFLECVQVKADKSSMKKREYKRLKKYDYMQTVFLVRRIVIDLGYEKKKEKERSGH